MDDSKRCCFAQFSSHKSRRVVRLSSAGEILAFADAFEHAFNVKHDLQGITGKAIPLLTLTDSKILLDVITGNKYTTECRLMVDIAAIREAFEQKIISNIGLIRRQYHAADG